MTRDDARREAELIEARMRARRARLHRPANGAGARAAEGVAADDASRNDAGATVRGGALRAADVSAAGDVDGDDEFPRSVTMRWITRRPVATLAVALPVAALLVGNRSIRRALPGVARWAVSPAGLAAAGALAKVAGVSRR